MLRVLARQAVRPSLAPILTPVWQQSRSHLQRRQDHVEWFETSASLEGRRVACTEDNPLIVLLEGAAGSNKQKLLERLGKIGYTVGGHSFVDAVAQGKGVEEAQEESHRRFLAFLEEVRGEGKVNKDALAFYLRSTVSNALCAKEKPQEVPAAAAKKELRRTLAACGGSARSATVLCLADELVTRQQLGARYFYADEKEKAARDLLREQEETAQEGAMAAYNALLENRVLDARVHTTSVKQAMPAMLNLFGVFPSLFREDYGKEAAKE